jgi:hypothetical protein
MKIIISNPNQLNILVCKIACGDEIGSGFIISDNHIITARHVIIDHLTDGGQLKIRFLGEANIDSSLTFELVKEDENLDVAIIKSSGSLGDTAISLKSSDIRYNESWETLGFPYSKSLDAGRYYGKVIKINQERPYDLELSSLDVDPDFDYSGLSGAPLIINGYCLGFITWSIANGLGAVSIKKIHDWLSLSDIPVEENDFNDIPKEFLEELDSLTQNDEVIETIDRAVSSGGKFYLLHGTPGSGKTTIAASYTPSNANFTVVGRYLVGITDDNNPLTYKASRLAFIIWLEDLVNRQLSGEATAKTEMPIEERIKRLSEWLTALNDFYLSRNKIALIIVDGLDDVVRAQVNSLNEFLSVIKHPLPSNISILLSCTTENLLPVDIKTEIVKDHKIKVLPLSQGISEQYIHKVFTQINLKVNAQFVRKLSIKAEGHPLYLRYLTESLRNSQISDPDAWLDTLPVIDGDIEKYYEKLWTNLIETDTDKFWILLTVSQLRQGIGREELVKMLPMQVRHAFTLKFVELRHLFKAQGQVRLYHSSFDIFIESKAGIDARIANTNIATYCEKNQNYRYGVINWIHHILQSENPQPVIKACDQTWADRCALVHMEPDLLLDDIGHVEEFCIDQGKFTDVIGIKLLLQRIRFRYNSVLAASATEIANALIAMGNTKDALNYLLRENLLLISDDEAIYFLQKLYEADAFSEADILQDAIRYRFTDLLEIGRSEGVFTTRPFLLYLQALTLATNINFKDGRTKFYNVMTYLIRLGSNEEESEEFANMIENLCKYMGSWFNAYCLFRFNAYPSREDIIKKLKRDFDDTWAGNFAMVSIHYFYFKEKSALKHEPFHYQSLLKDIEYVIDNYGYQEKDTDTILSALLEESSRTDIVERLIATKLQTSIPFELRQKNGVDADIKSIHNLINNNLYQGYIDSSNSYPKIIGRIIHGWENNFTSLLTVLGFCMGKGFRLRAENQLHQIKNIEDQLQLVIKQLDFNLKERVSWDRSYSLPESVVPFFYQKIFIFYLEFDRSGLDAMVGLIEENGYSQLGLYTEGYRKTLGLILNLLTKEQELAKYSFRILKMLEKHTEDVVQNRWQRIPELLNIVEYFGQIGNNSRAEANYLKMLNTSMGPSWYKEDQFALINKLLKQPSLTKIASPFYKYFASYIEFASGEMTFQRFVQGEKHSFIGSLAKANQVGKAIAYFKYQLLPSPEIIIKNAEASIFDVSEPGNGYIYGAHAIIAASASIQLLKNTSADPLIKLGLSELYILNDDTNRYVDLFAELQSEWLKDTSSSDDFTRYIERLVQIITWPELTDHRYVYIKTLAKNLPTSIFNELKSEMKKFGITEIFIADIVERISSEAEERSSRHIPDDAPDMGIGMGTPSNFAKTESFYTNAISEIEMENLAKARSSIREGLKLLHEGETDIWQGGYLSPELGKLYNLLPQIGTPDEVIKSLKEFITKHYTKDWLIVHSLIGLFSNSLSEEESSRLITIIKDHIEYLIHSNDQLVNDFEWIDLVPDSNSPNAELVYFLLWNLNHPFSAVKKRAINTITWLGNTVPNLVIPALVREAFKTDLNISAEASLYLLTKTDQANNSTLWSAVKDVINYKDKILNCDHFSKKWSMLKILQNVSHSEADAKPILDALQTSLPKTNNSSSDIYLDEEYLEPVLGQLGQIGSLEILDRSFCDSFLTHSTTVFEPLTINEKKRVDKYVKRSFYQDRIDISSYDYGILASLNINLTQHVGLEKGSEVYQILKLPFL